MKKTWFRWSAAYAARPLLIRLLIAVVLLSGVVTLERRLLSSSALAASRQQSKMTIEANQMALADLQARTAQLEEVRRVDPNAEARQRLQSLRDRAGELEKAIWDAEGHMVTAKQMHQLLKNLLRRQSGVRLLEFRTLPPVPLVAIAGNPNEQEGKGSKGEKVVAIPSARENNLFRHGIRLRLEGRYPDLLAYLSALEKSPQRLVWDSLRITAEDYPRVELELTVFTVNLEERWLVV